MQRSRKGFGKKIFFGCGDGGFSLSATVSLERPQCKSLPPGGVRSPSDSCKN